MSEEKKEVGGEAAKEEQKKEEPKAEAKEVKKEPVREPVYKDELNKILEDFFSAKIPKPEVEKKPSPEEIPVKKSQQKKKKKRYLVI